MQALSNLKNLLAGSEGDCRTGVRVASMHDMHSESERLAGSEQRRRLQDKIFWSIECFPKLSYSNKVLFTESKSLKVVGFIII